MYDANPDSLYMPNYDMKIPLSRVTFDAVDAAQILIGTTMGGPKPPKPGLELCSVRHDFAFALVAGGLGGYINDGKGNIVHLLPFGPGVSIAYELPYSEMGGGHCAECSGRTTNPSRAELLQVQSSTEEDQSTTTTTVVNDELYTTNIALIDDDICVVDVAFAFTKRAAAQTNIQIEASLGISDMNDALINSRVYNIKYRLAGVTVLDKFEFYVTDGGSTGAMSKITTDADGELATFMTQTGADQLVVMSPREVFNNLAGVSQLTTTPSERRFSMAVVGYSGRYTIQHELAHNHGCRHDDVGSNDPGGNGQLNGWARGHMFVYEECSTILGVLTPRAKHFSNPDVNAPCRGMSAPSGRPNRNNARQIRESACFQSGQSGQPTVVALPFIRLIPAEPCSGYPVSLELVLAECTDIGAQNLRWFYQMTPTSPRVYLSSTSTSLQFSPPVTNRGYDVFVEGQCSDGLPIFAKLRVYPPICCPDDLPRTPPALSFAETTASNYSVSRINGTVFIKFKRPVISREYHVHVADLLGRVLYRRSGVERDSLEIPVQSAETIIVSVITDTGMESTIFVHANH